MSNVVIVGGGLAGLAAAVGLARHGVSVTLLESRTRLGGRASSFRDPATGRWIDNCQHVSMGCCTNFDRFCRWTGIGDLFSTERRLYFVAADNRVVPFAAAPLPAPLHLLPALARLSYLSLADRRAIARGLRVLMAAEAEPGAFADWLAAQRQPATAVEGFWQVVLVSALSESLERIDTRAARKVFWDGFLRNTAGWKVQIPRVPLQDVYGKRLSAWLAAHDVRCEYNARASELVTGAAGVEAVGLTDGRRVSGDDFVLALPWFQLRHVLPSQLSAAYEASMRLQAAPISSVHLWTDRRLTGLPHAVLVGRLSQWMFDRTQAEDRRAGQWYYQVVISASRELSGRTQTDVVETVWRELCGIWPSGRSARLLHAKVVTEQRAVFAPLPDSDSGRCPQQSPLPHLQMAGDWTRTGWPSTMESAVRSGFLAAENILARNRRPARLLAADLPVGLLSKRFFGH